RPPPHSPPCPSPTLFRSHHRHHAAVGGHGEKVLPVRPGLPPGQRIGRGGGRGGHEITAGSRPPASKQLWVPVWQAGPCACTWISTASPSQSSSTPRTSWILPEVSPLRQYSPRGRDQNTTRPVVRVRCSASSSIQPNIS